MHNAIKEMEFVKQVSEAAIAAPFGLYAEAWGFNDKRGNGSDSNPFLAPLMKPMQAVFRNMQQELDDALKIDIYHV